MISTTSIHASIRRAGALSLVACAVALAGCAAPANRDAMTPTAIASAKKLPYSLSVQTAGGNQTDAMGSSEISNDDLRAAIEKAVTQSSLFKEIVKGKSGDYELSVIVTRLTKPSIGFSFTVEMEAGWSLVKTSDKSVAMRKSVVSTYTASAGAAFAGTTRLRLAVEGAARENIKNGLEAIAGLNL
jgi:hypothetical protein